MLLDYAENAVQMLACMTSLLLCLFRYISTKHKAWLLATAAFLAFLPTSYMWTSYLVIMGETPYTSDLLAYLGSNLTYLFMLALVLSTKSPRERGYFTPVMLLPIPINLWQLSIYLPYGGAFNSVYQVLVNTAIACLSVQRICWFWKNRERGVKPPRIAVAALVFVMCEFGMWTSSCFYEPVRNLYYVFSFLCSADFLFIVWAVDKTYSRGVREAEHALDVRFENVLKSVYLILMAVCSIGGIFLCQRIRDAVGQGAGAAASGLSDVLPIILFMISLFPVAFAAVILFVASHIQEGAVIRGASVAEEQEDEDSMAQEAWDEESKIHRTNLLIPISIIFCLMVCMVVYSSYAIRDVAVANVHEVGVDRLSGVSAQLENYLDMTKSLVWVTADTVDYMSQSGLTTDEMQRYLVEETSRQVKKFDNNFTGLYGYVQGVYIDGLNWVPPAGYDPTQRQWYQMALEAEGEVAIVPPYVDAQTGEIVISICRMLSNGTDVIALDARMNHIQGLVHGLKVMEKGYGFVVDQDGLIIAHGDESLKGTNLNDTEEGPALLSKILEVGNGSFVMQNSGHETTVFVQEIIGQWHSVIVVGTDELLSEVWQSLMVNVIICVAIFSLIAFFYQLGQRNEQAYARRIEEMRTEEQRQAYEARALKLEKEAADRANNAKSEFLANMSHEIRTPINAVLGMNEMVLRASVAAGKSTSLDSRAARKAFERITTFATNIESAGKNLLSIINDILDFSKIEAGRMDIVEGKYRLGSVLNDVSNMVYFKAKEKGLDFVVDVDESIPDGLFGDEVRVRQVIINILSNAVKYTEEGCVRLEVRSETVVGEGEGDGRIRLCVTVQDTGIGIKPEDQERLFRKFERMDLSQNSTKEGTGLGLAITKELLELMGGSIDVQSTYGVGSSVSVTIPQGVTSWVPVGSFKSRFAKTMAGAEEYVESFHAPDARILVVDDVRMNLVVVAGLLSQTGIRIDSATSGEEAIQMAQAQPYDLILMDSRMPQMDGTEAMHRIRQIHDGPNRNTPFVCLTADAVSGAREHYLAEGFTDYLSKPIDGHILERMLVRHLPADKISLGRVTEASAEGASGDEGGVPEGLEALRNGCVDAQVGLGYCQGNEPLYRSLMGDYLAEVPRRVEELEEHYASRDWEDYAILAHSLKSTSRMIGALELADVAERMEHAADARDVVAVRAEHGRMLELLRDVAATLRLVCDDVPADGLDDDDAEILEFLPE